jgi:hypothetical protein
MVSILGEEDAVMTGITEDMLRVSCNSLIIRGKNINFLFFQLSTGLEAINDIIADFEGAFEVTFSEDEVVSPTID